MFQDFYELINSTAYVLIFKAFYRYEITNNLTDNSIKI